MDSQIDTAQRRAADIHRSLVLAPTREARASNLLVLEEALQQTRRAALEEASKVVQEKAEFICHDYDQNLIGDLEWFHRELVGRFADYACDALDRLREGVGK